MATSDSASTPPAEPAISEGGSIQAALQLIASLLVPGETISTYAVQRRIHALVHRRMVVVGTSGRLMALERHVFGGYTLHDIRWQDMKQAHLSAGPLAADLEISAFAQPDLATAGQLRTLSIRGLRKDQAQAVYRLCQGNDQAWREKRRIRELEELRAKSGGIQMGGGSGFSAPAAGAAMDPVAKLSQAKEMLDKGLISDAEYESLKARIVSSM
jgi:Short C-terminal domain